ncbi:MAG: type VI secretion system baseplate subunit TssG [Alphaproteobacteria bacterium]|nr:type VI secretion system baseplate subunit TssG [Alphaproteobacteria bacterium]
MAPTDRPAPDHLTMLARAAPAAGAYGVLALVRAAEARAGGLPRVGLAKRPGQNVVDLAQAPSLNFAAATLESIEVTAGRAKVTGHWLGLTGPMGPLPLHLTEFAAYERRYARTRPFGDFLDLLAGRMLQLFYRAWADSQPAAQADRADDDSFGRYLGALTGAADGVTRDARFPAQARLFYAGVFGGRRSAAAIQDALTLLLGMPAEVREFQPRWREIGRDEQSCLGRSFATLGTDALAGARIRAASDAFRVVVRATDLGDFQTLLPTGSRFALAAEALSAFAPDHLEWDLLIELDESCAPPARLDGRAMLGWTSWLAPGRVPRLRSDVRLRRTSAAPGLFGEGRHDRN